MRQLVYLLLVANLFYLGWNVFESRFPGEPERHLPPIPAAASPLVTLQEREAAADSVDGVSSIEDLITEQPPGAGANILCQALGPFLAVEKMQAVESTLVELGLQPTQRELESKQLTGYWVYLPAMSQEEVRAVLAILEEHRDKEYYVGKTNFISLGTFREFSRAERRLKVTRKMGLDAILQERFSSRSNYWLDIQGDATATESLSKIADSHPELQLVELACY